MALPYPLQVTGAPVYYRAANALSRPRNGGSIAPLAALFAAPNTARGLVAAYPARYGYRYAILPLALPPRSA